MAHQIDPFCVPQPTDTQCLEAALERLRGKP